MVTKRNKSRRKIEGRAEAMRSLLVDKADQLTLSEDPSSRWSYISISMHKFICGTPELQIVSESSINNWIDFLRKNTLDHARSQKYGLCFVLVSGIETWLHSKHAAQEMTLAEIGRIIGSPVNLSEALEATSKKHPWAPGHELGEDFWSIVTLMFESLDSEKISVEDKLLVAEKLKSPTGLVFVRNLIMHTNYLKAK